MNHTSKIESFEFCTYIKAIEHVLFIINKQKKKLNNELMFVLIVINCNFSGDADTDTSQIYNDDPDNYTANSRILAAV